MSKTKPVVAGPCGHFLFPSCGCPAPAPHSEPEPVTPDAIPVPAHWQPMGWTMPLVPAVEARPDLALVAGLLGPASPAEALAPATSTPVPAAAPSKLTKTTARRHAPGTRNITTGWHRRRSESGPA